MANADDVRRLALALDDVVEIESDGFDFRVGGRGFVWSYPERVPGRGRTIRTDIAVLYVGDEAEKQALLLGEPDLFFTAPGYGGFPLVMLRLERVGVRRLRELVTDAWRLRSGDPPRVASPCSDVRTGTVCVGSRASRPWLTRSSAGVAQWQSPSLPSWPCRFDPGRPLR